MTKRGGYIEKAKWETLYIFTVHIKLTISFKLESINCGVKGFFTFVAAVFTNKKLFGFPRWIFVCIQLAIITQELISIVIIYIFSYIFFIYLRGTKLAELQVSFDQSRGSQQQKYFLHGRVFQVADQNRYKISFCQNLS